MISDFLVFTPGSLGRRLVFRGLPGLWDHALYCHQIYPDPVGNPTNLDWSIDVPAGRFPRCRGFRFGPDPYGASRLLASDILKVWFAAGVGPVKIVTQSGDEYGLLWARVGNVTVGRGTNRPPEALSISLPQTAVEGAPILAVLRARDPDGDPLRFSATPLPAGASLDSVTGRFLWTPPLGSAGAYPIRFEASDGATATAQVATIRVTRTAGAVVGWRDALAGNGHWSATLDIPLLTFTGPVRTTERLWLTLDNNFDPRNPGTFIVTCLGGVPGREFRAQGAVSADGGFVASTGGQTQARWRWDRYRGWVANPGWRSWSVRVEGAILSDREVVIRRYEYRHQTRYTDGTFMYRSAAEARATLQ
jgi:hypothetical protein